MPSGKLCSRQPTENLDLFISSDLSADSANSKMSLTYVGEGERMGQSEEKTLPRVGGGGRGEGGGVFRRKKSLNGPTLLFISFLPINALQLPKKKYPPPQKKNLNK